MKTSYSDAIPTTQPSKDRILPEVAHDQIKVVGAGFCRTGTRSLREALNILGFKCFHMDDISDNPSIYPKLWSEIADQKPEERDFDKIYKENNFSATVDFPASIFYKDHISYYPNAKVILTVRENADVWYKSVFNTIYLFNQAIQKSNKSTFNSFVKLFSNSSMANFGLMTKKIVWDGIFRGEFENEVLMKQIYNDWIEDAKKTVPKEKLLILDLKANKGKWEPLCEFLNVPVPKDTPFPFSNKTKDKLDEMDRFKRPQQIFHGVMMFAFVSAIGYGVYRYYFGANNNNSNGNNSNGNNNDNNTNK